MAVRNGARGELFLRRRIGAAFGLILLCYGGLVGRLLYLQGVAGPDLLKEAVKSRQMTIPLPARRGTILDRNGSPMAVSSYSGVAGFDPSVLVAELRDPKRAKDLDARLAESVRRAADLLQIPETALSALVKDACEHPVNSRGVKKQFLVVKRDIALETAQQIRDAKPRLLGFAVQDGTKRVYISRRNAAQVVGLTDPDSKGIAGLEFACNKWLDGKKGEVLAEVDDRKREIPFTEIKRTSARDGCNAQTTLDANIQHIATEEAQKIVDRYLPDGVSIVVVEPDSGDILALVSMPNYDPGPEGRKSIKPAAMTDRCAHWLYEPGSTMKALTIAAALNDGTITPNSGFNCAGMFHIDNRKAIHCDSHGGSNVHGWVNAAEILRVSCNVGAAQVGLAMGPHKLFDAEKNFGLLDKLPIDLPNSHGVLSFDRREKIYSRAKAARVAFGHSIMTTPLHLALAYAAIANGGNLMQPRLVMALKDDEGKIKQEWKPTVTRRVLSPEVAAEVTRMMQGVVTGGTGKVAAVPGFDVAGKTGTASKYRRGSYVGSFGGFLPTGTNIRPRAVVLVVVDEPRNGAHYGADVAAPAFQAISARLMRYWNVPETDPNATQFKTAQAKIHHK